MEEDKRDIENAKVEKPLKRKRKILAFIGILLFLLTLLSLFSLKFPFVQTQIAWQGIDYLSDQLGTEVSASDIKVDIYNDLYLENFLIRDEQEDTLLFTKQLKIDVKELGLFKNKLHINDILIDGAYINLNAINDSTFNYQFALDAFKNEGNNEIVKEEKETQPFDFDLDKIVLSNTHFAMNDEWQYLDLHVKVPELAIETNNINFDEALVEAKYLHVKEPLVNLITYPIDDEDDDEDNDTTLTFLPDLGIDLKVADLQLIDGLFTLQGASPKYTNSGYIDWENMEVSDINLIADNASYIGDTISGKIEKINLTEISGFTVNRLSGNFFMNKNKVNIEQLTLETPNSKLGNSYTMKFKSFEDFLNFEDKVFQDIKLSNSILDIKDIEYFVPYFSENKVASRFDRFKKAQIEGRIYGTIDNLKGKKIKIKSDESFFAGDFKLKGLPDINTTFIDFDVDRLYTHIDDVIAILPEVSFPDNTKKLGRIDFSGNFLGFISDFVARGELETDLGSAVTDLNMKIKGMDNATYSGNLSVRDFELGTFLGQEQTLGNITFDTRINGSGLSFSSAKADMKGTIQSFDFNGYSYRDVKIDGRLDKQLFNGDFSIEQEDVNLNFSGVVDLAREKPQFKFDTQVVRLDLQKLNLAPNPYILSFKSDFNIEGTDIDDFQGSAMLEDISIEKDGKIYPIATARIVSIQNEKGRNFAIVSDVADIGLKGNFSFRNLSNTFKEYLTNYFPYNIQYDDTLATRDLAIDFDIRLKKTTNITQLFLPKLETVEGGKIKGSFNNRSRYLNLNASIPAVNYDGVEVKDIELDALSDEEELLFQLDVDTVRKDNFAVPLIKLAGFVHSDTLDLHLTANADTAFNRLDAHGLAVVKDARLSVQMDSMLLVVAGQDWRMSQEEMYFKNWDDYSLQDWDLTFQDQYFRLTSEPKEETTWAEVVFNDINLKEYLEMAAINEELKAAGTLNGKVEVKNFLKKPLLTGDIAITDAILLGQDMGTITAEAIKEPGINKINLTALVESELYNASAKGYYDLDAPEYKALFVEADVAQFSLEFIETFLGGEIYDTEGFARGSVRVSGAAKAPKLNGELFVQDVKTTIKLLNTSYTVEDEYVVFEDNELYLEELILRDKFNNVAELNGTFDLANFQDLAVSVDITTDQFLLLDTKRETASDQLYYGTALGAGFMIFDGPINDIYMYLNLETLENTKLYLPLSDDYGVAENTVYSFVVKDTTSVVIEEAPKPFEFQIDMDFELTPLAELQLIFDYQAGDIIKANGMGNIQMDYDSRSDIFDIYGEYVISEGDYLFTMQNVINKRFDIKQGSTINFYGDPYKAKLDIATAYRFKTSLYELVETVNTEEDNELRQRVPVELYLNLSGELAAPEIDFFIDVPETSFNSANSTARQRLDQINNDVDKNELNKQVFGLMVFNKFLPANTDLFGNEYLTSSVSTTMSEFLSNQFSTLLSETIGELIPNSEWGVNWRNYSADYSANATDLENTLYNRNEIELTYRQKLFNNRVIIDLGGNFDLGETADDSYDNVALAGDFVVQYKITPDGFYRVKLFAKTDSDIFTGRYNKTGVSLFVTEDFDNMKDLVRILKNRRKLRKEKKQKKKQQKK